MISKTKRFSYERDEEKPGAQGNGKDDEGERGVGPILPAQQQGAAIEAAIDLIKPRAVAPSFAHASVRERIDQTVFGFDEDTQPR